MLLKAIINHVVYLQLSRIDINCTIKCLSI